MTVLNLSFILAFLKFKSGLNLTWAQTPRDRCVWPRYRKGKGSIMQRRRGTDDCLTGVFIAAKCRGIWSWKLLALNGVTIRFFLGKKLATLKLATLDWSPCKKEPNIRQLSVSNSKDWSRSLLGNLLRLRHGVLAKVVWHRLYSGSVMGSKIST